MRRSHDTVIRPTRPAADRRDHPRDLIGEHLAAAARTWPDDLAVVEGPHRLTYEELDERVERVGRSLRALGVARGDVVTVELPNWWETSVLIHAVLRIGGVPNPVVPIYRDREMSFIIAQARPRVVVVPHRFRQYDYVAMLQRIVGMDGDDGPVVLAVRPEGELPAGIVDFGSLLVEDGQDSHGAEPGDACVATDIALLLYTSGTTADPKGVLHDHSTLEHENRSIIELFSLDRGSTVFMGSPVTHITGFLYGVLLPPMLGVPVALLDVWDAGRRAS